MFCYLTTGYGFVRSGSRSDLDPDDPPPKKELELELKRLQRQREELTLQVDELNRRRMQEKDVHVQTSGNAGGRLKEPPPVEPVKNSLLHRPDLSYGKC